MEVFPVIASTISAKELGDFVVEKYGLVGSYDCKLFRTGMNHTYYLSEGETKYVIRVYSHNWRSKSEIVEEIKLLNLLKDNNLSISYPLQDKSEGFIQEIEAPEGIRYVVLFSFAKGGKVRFMSNKTCYKIGALMARFHKLTEKSTIDRISYNQQSLFEAPYKKLKDFFSEELPEMQFIKEQVIAFKDSDFKCSQIGIVHMDIWYDNMAVSDENEITIFDFDFCGNGWRVLDIGYFCNQLFNIGVDKEEYEVKKKNFLGGYKSISELPEQEIALIPKAGLAVFIFYLGIQAQRFDWSNIFLSENYLKMYVGRMKSWVDYTR
ncbi:phosphotransferase [Joostella atrarenae]|uniref:Phosphotransferase n=1 Tax=Joostella atrarenae TaxID=679257 RepID=A0ABS9J4D8_9FLAO|nr:phosphotransferase [Joostella atrarenae]MCF8715282.1 phosphotransferase [Joostella atrarenae]